MKIATTPQTKADDTKAFVKAKTRKVLVGRYPAGFLINAESELNKP